jgi:hypothetical protein
MLSLTTQRGEVRNEYKILVTKLKKRHGLGALGVDEMMMMILKWILNYVYVIV